MKLQRGPGVESGSTWTPSVFPGAPQSLFKALHHAQDLCRENRDIFYSWELPEFQELEHSSVFNLITLQVNKVEPNEAGAARGRPPQPGAPSTLPSHLLVPVSSRTHDSRFPELLAAVTFMAKLGAEGIPFSFQNQCCTDSLSQF